MLNFKCDCCDKELKEPGALLFSPAIKFKQLPGPFISEKYHICVKCFEYIKRDFTTNKYNDE